MNLNALVPPDFWKLLAVCLGTFLLLWWFALAAGRIARRRTLRRRIAALDAQAGLSRPLALDSMTQSLAAARRAAEQAPQRPRFPLYARPWFLFIGDATADLPGLLDAAAEAPQGQRPATDDGFWQWRLLRSMIAIAIDPAALADPADPAERSRWYRALLELVERRRRLALNGIVVCVGAATLLGDARAAAASATALRALAEDAAEHLRLRLPVYLVVTGLERFEGYELARTALPAGVLEQALGYRVGRFASRADVRFELPFDQLAERLKALRMALLSEQRDPVRRLAVHRFVEQLRALQPGLRLTAQRMFGGVRPSAALRWRGVYLTGAASGPGAPGGAFVWDLFARFLPADQPLAHSQTPRAARR